ncbi:MAG: aminopeptidase P family protein [Proteobacteria bacterium]|nr:aminopeptidase P family protein [Pseudomonadota bacterium]
MPDMPAPASLLPFSRAEHEGRIRRLRATMREEGLAALLVFAQNSHFYLTGYDTGGFVFFQCAVVTADDRPIVLLTRRPDLIQARQTSIIEDIRLWWDAEDANPAVDLKAILHELGLGGGRIGIELNTHGLTGWNLWRLQQALAGSCELVDGSHLVNRMRLIKSPAEIAYMRQAAALCDESLQAIIAVARPGIIDSTLTATYLKVILEGGGDMPPNAPLFNSGHRAVYGRGVSQPRRLEAVDQMLVEYPVPYRRYCVKTEWTLIFGKTTDRQRRMYEVARDTLQKMTDIARPGRTLDEIFQAHADGLDEAGFRKHRFGATGYSVGATFAPTSMDVPPMIYAGNPLRCEPGMTLFYHVMNGDTDTGYAMGVGHTLLVTEGAAEVLNPLPDALTEIV